MGGVLKFEFYFKDMLCTRCSVNYITKEIGVENFTDKLFLQAFGKRKMCIDEIDEFFRERCFPESRVDKDTLLEMLGLRNFDAEAICRKTHGMMTGDQFWIRFDDEPLSYDDIKAIRQW